ncbi:MAG: hypothetical protein IJ426_05825 [Clostridia bacterium]|nr:hypothetical protein [Clostridia bacterium]
MICAFFGHRNTGEDIAPRLREVIINLIENNGVDIFYVGNQGRFDGIIRRLLKEIQTEYSHIEYRIILAYMPVKKDEWYDYSNTVYPEELASVLRKFAIDRRNNWMIKRADFVVVCVSHNTGGAAKFKKIAERKNKKVINIIE